MNSIDFGVGITFISIIFLLFTLMPRTSSSSDSSFSAAQIVFEYNRVDADGDGGKLVKKSIKVKKPQRPEKS